MRGDQGCQISMDFTVKGLQGLARRSHFNVQFLHGRFDRLGTAVDRCEAIERL